MGFRRARIAALVIPAIAGILLAGCASSSTSSTKPPIPLGPKPVKQTATAGAETFTGNLGGTKVLAKHLTFPLTWTGPVDTTGTFKTRGTGPKAGQEYAFVTKAGTLELLVTSVPDNGNGPVPTPAKQCAFRSTTVVDFNVVPGKSTGAFSGATGSNGQVTVVSAGDLPKLKNGKCDESNNAEPTTDTVIATFTGHVDLTVKG
jgi:hypothetical protein